MQGHPSNLACSFIADNYTILASDHFSHKSVTSCAAVSVTRNKTRGMVHAEMLRRMTLDPSSVTEDVILANTELVWYLGQFVFGRMNTSRALA